MKYTIIIEADINDGDYIQRESIINDKELEFIKKIISVIKENKGHNWGSGEQCMPDEHPCVVYKNKLTEEEIEKFEEFLPWGEYGIHSVTAIKFSPKIKWTNLL